jgi:hypothetical protein
MGKSSEVGDERESGEMFHVIALVGALASNGV